MRKTKIVCTIGPATESEEMLEKMIQAGMNVARLNFSHGDHEEQLRKIINIRKVSKKLNKSIAIMLDTKGPEIRCGNFENGSVYFQKGDIVEIVSEPTLGNHERFYVNNKELFFDVKIHDILLIDDGKIKVEVVDTNGKDCFRIQFLTNGKVSNKKGINAPDVKLSMPYLSKQDIEDIRFGCENNVDIIALSFVRRKEDILQVQDLIENTFHHEKIDLMAKIECQEAINNLDEIIDSANSIMVARGDLGVELPIELVPNYQKEIILKSNAAGKPVVTATHMMESMIQNPMPTRAEASDVANAIYDGTDAIMLSGESTIGQYPVESVEYMNKIALAVEKVDTYTSRYGKFVNSFMPMNLTQNDAIGVCVCECSHSLPNVSAIFAFTQTGGTALRIAKFRPDVPIYACTQNESTKRKMQVCRGVESLTCDYVKEISLWDQQAQALAKQLKLPKGSTIILTSGVGMDHGSTNTIRLLQVK